MLYTYVEIIYVVYICITDVCTEITDDVYIEIADVVYICRNSRCGPHMQK